MIGTHWIDARQPHAALEGVLVVGGREDGGIDPKRLEATAVTSAVVADRDHGRLEDVAPAGLRPAAMLKLADVIGGVLPAVQHGRCRGPTVAGA